jgi:hypothetical protein
MSPSADELVAEACRRTDLSDFGSDSYREGLERWTHAVAKAPVRNDTVIPRVREMAVVALVNRLRVTRYEEEHPEVLDERIERPLMVMGMPRSGTTLVSYLLDQDPHRRSLLVWEAWESVPPPTSGTLRTDPRCLARLDAQLREIAREPVQLHLEMADGPTECLRLHGQDFKGLMWEGPIQVPDWSKWLEHADLRSAYEYQRRVLRILQSKAPGTWSLKMPSHALFVDSLLAVFPDARLVWTHRDPYRALGSVISLKTWAWERYTGNPALDVVLDYYPEQMRNHLMRPLAARARGADIYDLRYADVMRDPIGAMRSLYAWAGDELTPEAEAGMLRWLEENPQGKHGAHAYDLERFGLSVADVEPLFAEYLEAVEVEPEGF